MSLFKNLFGGDSKDPEKLYKHALELFGQEKFQDAAVVLEETAGLNPNSAPVQFTLGVTYSRIAGEFGKDEEKILPWLKKAADCLQKAMDISAKTGELNEQQLTIARDIVVAADRVSKKETSSLEEDQRKKIFADFMETQDSEFLMGANILQDFKPSSGDLLAMGQILNKSGAQADTATYGKISKKYGISEAQLNTIVEEGKQKKWSFKGVVR
jgi:LysM repeat protein